ncbi:MAG: MFS superfamily sugar transporter [Idiomarinaceae bacterium HL-53]|nr:MAG: MFS superfamily sugar transporter [Idiomarinaceae bacterium HL-53]CUS48086.1 Nitrate/nitrite transporter NarK [Idiomarinaceae bacterium HL-53]
MTTQAQVAGTQPSPLMRWVVLLFVSMAMFGNYYVYDALGPVYDLLQQDVGFSYEQIGQITSAYNIAALLVLLVGGYIIDRFGTKKAIFVFAVICLLGSLLRTAFPHYGTMFAGQFLLGMGSEPLIVAATATLAKWFKGRELSLAFGLNLSISRLGSFSADQSTNFASGLYSNWQDPLWLATGVAAVSVAAAMLYWMAERRAESQYTLGQAEETEKLKWSDIYNFGRSYWYVVALCVVFYATIFPFRSFAIDYFQQAHGLSRQAAGTLNSVLPMAAIIATPLFGLLIDRVGKRALFMAGGVVIMAPLFLLATYLPPGPVLDLGMGDNEILIPLTLIIVMVLFGLVFSLIPAAMWPSVAYIVDERRIGSAYALMTFCQQMGWAVVPLVIGKLNTHFEASPDNIAGYEPGMWFYTGLALFGLFFAFKLWVTEKGPHGHGLDTITTRNS